MNHETIFAAGAGLMGRDISLLFANYGYNVILFDVSKDALKRAIYLHREKIGKLRGLGILRDEYAYENILYT